MNDNLEVGKLISLYAKENNFSIELLFHSLNVSRIAEDIGKELGLIKREIDELKVMALLHDIGKSKTPSKILYKPGKLSSKECNIMNTHAENSEVIILNSKGLYLKQGNVERYGKIVRAHHEKFVGGGYPDNLKGEEIPFMARIITIADVFEAITSPRIYRPTMVKNPLKIMNEEIGNTFDPYIYKNYASKVINKYYNMIANE